MFIAGNRVGKTDAGAYEVTLHLTGVYPGACGLNGKAPPLLHGLWSPKVLVTANSSGVISLQFTTFGVSAPAGVPLITQVLNGSSGIPLGSPNYGIAPSSLFAVVGSGLADPGIGKRE